MSASGANPRQRRLGVPAVEDSRTDLDVGRQHLREGRSAEAVKVFQAACQATPSGVEARLWLGVALAQAGDLPGAVGQLQSAAESAPASALVAYNLAVVLERAGELHQAKVCYERVLKLQADHPRAAAAAARLKDLPPPPEPTAPNQAPPPPLAPATTLDDQVELIEWHAGAWTPASQADYEFFWGCWNNRGGGVPIGEKFHGGTILRQLDEASPKLAPPAGCIACGEPSATTLTRSCTQVTRNVLRNLGAPPLEHLSPLGAKGNRARFHCEWGLCAACASQWQQAKAVLRRLLQPPFNRFGGLKKLLSENYNEAKTLRALATGKLPTALTAQRDDILNQVWELLKPLGVLGLPWPSSSLRVFSFSTGTWHELVQACSGLFPVFPPPRSGEIAVEVNLVVPDQAMLDRIREANPQWANLRAGAATPPSTAIDETLLAAQDWRQYTYLGRWQIGEAISSRRVTVRHLLADVVS